MKKTDDTALLKINTEQDNGYDYPCTECDDFDGNKCCFCTWRQEQDALYMREVYKNRATTSDQEGKK